MHMDHLHQGSLAMEREWSRHKCWHYVLATIFVMCIVDSYLAYKYEAHGVIQVLDDFKTFIGKLAMALIKTIPIVPP